MMEKRKLGKSGLDLTEIGFGTWAIGGDWSKGWGPQDDKDSIAAIQRGLDLGINWIDTAHAYGFGHSEEIVGKAVKGRRNNVIIATKCGIQKMDDGMTFNLKRDRVREEIEGSLKRLDVDAIDLYQVHWPTDEEHIEEAWEEIAKAIDEGKIRHAGVSNFSPEQMERCNKIRPVESLQPPYHMFNTSFEENLADYCREKNIGVVVYSPMASGLLTGKVDKEWVENLPDSDWRKDSENFNEPKLSANIEFVESTLRPIAEEHGVKPAQIAIAWTLRDPVVTSAIVGARNPGQIEETVKASEISLSTAQLDQIKRGLRERTRELAVK